MKRMLCISLMVLIVGLTLGANGKQETQEKSGEKLVNLKMYQVGGGDDDNDLVWGKINEYLTEKMNTTVEPIIISFSDRQQKVPMILASGETYDIMFLAAWNFMDTITEGAYVPLDDMLPEYGPNLLRDIPEVGWNTGTFEGKRYMVPKNETEYNNKGLIVREDLRVKYNAPKPVDLDSILEFCRIMKENEPNLIPFNRDTSENYISLYFDAKDYGNFSTQRDILYYSLDDFSKVVNLLEHPDFRGEYLDFCREMYLNGYWSKSILSNQTSDREAFENGLSALCMHNVFVAGQVAKKVESSIPGAKVEYYSFDDGNKVDMQGFKAGNAISITSPNPERSLMFLDAAQSDFKLYKMIHFGIEGIHYAMTPDGKLTVPEGKTSDDIKYPAFITRAFYNSNIQPSDVNEWPRYREVQNELAPRAVGNPLVPFAFISDPVSSELAAVNNLAQTYLIPLQAGVLDSDEVWDEMIDEFNKAGLPRLVDEFQSQLTAFLAQ
jgi:putative aldouronate transport system substrate-binding protein